MIFLDTGYLVALMRPLDELHERALEWSSCLNEHTVTTEYVIWEVINQIRAPQSRESLHLFVDGVRGDPECEMIAAEPALFEAGMALHRSRSDKEWSLTDCISFYVMRDRGITRALAHDHHFEQAGFEALLRREAP